MFSALIPALYFTATINLPIIIGNVASGGTLTYADLVDGSFTSEPDFSPAVKGTAVRGGDHITIDPSGSVLRLHLDTLIKTDDDGYIRITATGAEVATPEVWNVLNAVSGAAPVKFGDFQATSSWTFETGTEKYAELQNAVYVGSTSLKPGTKNSTIVVGFKIAKVVSVQTDISV
ncbi:hypothetical protein ACN47E_010054 [Coniothyrium glycines]